MIKKVEHLSKYQLKKIRELIGEAFVTNELFHDWGSYDERHDDVMTYLSLYVDYVYRAGELYANEDLTGFIGLEDSAHARKLPQIWMLIRMMAKIRRSRLKSLLNYADQIRGANAEYAKQRHLDVLMVCVDKKYQGQGIATELVEYAKNMSDELDIPVLFDTDMKDYAEMYRHLGCELYNKVTADNGVTRYCLCYKNDQ